MKIKGSYIAAAAINLGLIVG